MTMPEAPCGCRFGSSEMLEHCDEAELIWDRLLQAIEENNSWNGQMSLQRCLYEAHIGEVYRWAIREEQWQDWAEKN